MSEQIEAERERFEGWAIKQGLRIHKDERGEYLSIMNYPQILERHAQCPECGTKSLLVIQHEGKKGLQITKRCQTCYYSDPPLLLPWWKRIRVGLFPPAGLILVPTIILYDWRDKYGAWTDWDLSVEFLKWGVCIGIKRL